MDYEKVILVKNEVFVYRIPPRPSNRGYRAADWSLDSPFWTGRLRLVARGNDLTIKLEDRTSGELYAKCPVDAFPGVAVEAVLDSSRYFVIRLASDDGRTAFTGIGFAERSDSFDFNVAIQDHFKSVKQEKEIQESETKLQSQPSLDLGFKEGQTIKLNLNTRRAGDAPSESTGISRPRSTLLNKANPGSVGLLPPPPAPSASRSRGIRSVPAPVSSSNAVASSINAVQSEPSPADNRQENTTSNIDILNDLFGPAKSNEVSLTPKESAALSWADFS